MDKVKVLKQKARIPDDSIIAIATVKSDDETVLDLKKDKRYIFSESELNEYTQQVSREKDTQIEGLKKNIIELRKKLMEI